MWYVYLHIKCQEIQSDELPCLQYYFSPKGKRYRSRAEICRDFEILDDRTPRVHRVVKPAPKLPFKALEREEAYAKAKARYAAVTMPMKTSMGVTVTALGTAKDDKAYITQTRIWPPGYCSEYTDEKGVQFVNSITEAPAGPVFRIKARAPEDNSEAFGAFVEVGSGPTPDAAIKLASDRQAEALEIALAARMQRGAGTDSDEDELDEEGLEAPDRLLLKAGALNCQWGTERFGLADKSILQAIEGLPGVDKIQGYTFVDERDGWDSETRRLHESLQRVGKTPGKIPPGSGKRRDRRGESSRKRSRTQEERDAEVVQRVVQHIIKNIELEIQRNMAAEVRARAAHERHMQKVVEKEHRRLAREQEREQARRLVEEQREAQRKLFLEAQKRAEEEKRVEPDETLSGADQHPPMPSSLATGKLPAASQPVLLECWQLVHRFAALLGLQDVPTLTQLEASLVDASLNNDAAVKVQIQLLDFLISDLFEEAVHQVHKKSYDIRGNDLKPHAKAQHPLVLKYETWTEVARRYLTILATTSALHAKEGGSGAAYPLSRMEPWLVLQYLTAGPPTKLENHGISAAPRNAAMSLTAVSDADALVEAEKHLMDRDVLMYNGTITRLLRCVLSEIANLKADRGRHGRVLCFGGAAAAAALKWGRPLDLRCIAARVDAGLYSCLPEPLEAFAADIRYVCELYNAAAAKASSDFANEHMDKGVPELAAMATSRLEAALTEISQLGQEEYLNLRLGKKQEAAEQAAASAGISASDPVRDLSRPFAPWTGCTMCWSEDDNHKLISCSACDCEWHLYCLSPPLDEFPIGTWTCPRCSEVVDKSCQIRFAKNSGGEKAWHLAEQLSQKEYCLWTPSERAELLSMLCSLVAESHPLHEVLADEEEALKEKRKEVNTLRQEQKKRQSEAAAASMGAYSQAELAPAPRSVRDEMEMENIVKQISKLEHEMSRMPPSRLEPAGLDRQWNRYWEVSGAAFKCEAAEPPPLLVVERSSSAPGGDWHVGCYSTVEQIDALLAWLNKKGVRERPLMEKVQKLRNNLAEYSEMKVRSEGNVTSLGENENTNVDDLPMEVDGPSYVEKLKYSLMEFEEGWMGGTHDGVRGNLKRRDAWRILVKKATTAPELMAALVILEQMVRPEWLKGHWRPWAMPAPSCENVSVLAPIWLRLEALKSAVKLKVTIKISTKLGGVPSGSRYPQRQQQNKPEERPEKKRGWWEENKEEEEEISEGSSGTPKKQKLSRAARAARRAGEMPEDDEALARRLNAELNSDGRATRGRIANAVHGGPLSDQGQYKDNAEEDDWEEDSENSEDEDFNDMEEGGGRRCGA